jgi:hypothetical protein
MVFPSCPRYRPPGERQPRRSVAAGLGNHEIARRLVLSEQPVLNNVAAILTKLQVPDRAAAVAKHATHASAPKRLAPSRHDIKCDAKWRPTECLATTRVLQIGR